MYDFFTGIIDPSHGFRNYRNALALTRPPLLPYLYVLGKILLLINFLNIFFNLENLKNIPAD